MSASRDLRSRLATLRQRMQHPTAYEKAIDYFGNHLAQNDCFHEQSVPAHLDGFEPTLKHLVDAVLGETVVLKKPIVMCLPGLDFYHGYAQAPGRVVTFLYAEDLGIGIAALVPGLRGGACEVARFRFRLHPLPHPERN